MRKQSYLVYIVGFLFCYKAIATVEFEPGIGLGFEYTDNAKLTVDNTTDDLIAVTYVGANISENEGPLKYGATAAFNRNDYTQGSFDDQRYFNLTARADWEMIRNRFDWFLSDRFSQLPVVSINSNVPDNLQDSNVFNFGANVKFPISARQSFSLIPKFSQYYYEVLLTDNKQYSLDAKWNYQMFRLTNVGLNFSARKIEYTEINLLGQSIEDTTFTTLGITFGRQYLRSNFSGSFGVTNVERENGDKTDGFSGFLKWLADFSSRSKFETLISTDLTDTSSVALSAEDNPVNDGADVQVTADVVRNSIVNFAYIREDDALHTRISAKYHKLTYDESPLDRVVHAFGVELNHPVTQLLSSGFYANYNRTEQLDTDRLDEYYTLGGNLKYRFSRKWQGLFDLKYRTKESDAAAQNYDEVSAFVSLVYGFGDVQRPSRAGGF